MAIDSHQFSNGGCDLECRSSDLYMIVHVQGFLEHIVQHRQQEETGKPLI